MTASILELYALTSKVGTFAASNFIRCNQTHSTMLTKSSMTIITGGQVVGAVWSANVVEVVLGRKPLS